MSDSTPLARVRRFSTFQLVIPLLIASVFSACATSTHAPSTEMDKSCAEFTCPDGLERKAIEFDWTDRTDMVCVDSEGVQQGPAWYCSGGEVSRTGQFEDGAKVGTFRGYPDGKLKYLDYASRGRMVLSCVIEGHAKDCEIVPLPLPCEGSKLPDETVKRASSRAELEAAFECDETTDDWKDAKVFWDELDVAVVKVPIPEPKEDHYYYQTLESVVMEGTTATIRIRIYGECVGSPAGELPEEQRQEQDGDRRRRSRTLAIEIPRHIEHVNYNVQLDEPPDFVDCNTRPSAGS
ncbi:MAG: hypothetical protein ACQEVA_11695 [Myxococcota bacterium]